MVDLSDAEFAETERRPEENGVSLKKLKETDRNTIFNVIIMENDEDGINE